MTVEPVITLFSVLLVAGAAQGLFLVLILLTLKQGHHVANRFLALLIFNFALELLDEFCLQSGYYVYFPKVSVLNWACDFLYGPLIFLYVRALTQTGKQVRDGVWLWLHGVPFAVFLAVGVVLWVSVNEESYLVSLFGSQEVLVLDIVDAITTLLSLISMVVYLRVSLGMLRHHMGRVQANFSYSENLGLRWLRNLLFGLSGLYLAYVFTLFTPVFLWNNVDLSNQIFYAAIVMSIFAWGFFGTRQPVIFSRRRLYGSGGEETEGIDTVPVKEKHRPSALAPEQVGAILVELRLLMDKERIFLDSQLALPQLAKRIGLSPNYVSQAINEGAGVNFFDFVNRYRVDEAKRQLGTEDAGNNLAIAMASGFNSKTAFYSAFKKHTGMTPSEFKHSLTADAG